MFVAKKFKNENELLAVNLKPSMDKNGMQNDQIYVRKGEIKIDKKNRTK